MLNFLRNYLRKTLIGPVKNYSYAQAGDDIILRYIFRKQLESQKKGFYVDIGAYHPNKDSNTYLLHKSGWNGINIDATPGSMKEFVKHRPHDINLEIGISLNENVQNYYWIGADSTMNSFSEKNLIDNGMRSQVKKIIPVKVLPLEKVLVEHGKKFETIDFLNIDVEGMDYEVLSSNNWNRFKPLVIAVELNVRTLDDVQKNKSALMLKDLGYNAVAKNIVTKDVATVFFVRNDFNY